MPLYKLFLLTFALIPVLSCATDISKRYPNMVANADPVSAGVFEANFERVFSSRVEKTEIEAVFHPRLNSVSLEFRHGLTNYRQFWDEAARLNFAAALELYKADYAEKNFDLRFRRSRAIYGRV